MDFFIAVLLIIAFGAYIYSLFFAPPDATTTQQKTKQQKPEPPSVAEPPRVTPKKEIDTSILLHKPNPVDTAPHPDTQPEQGTTREESFLQQLGYHNPHQIDIYLRQKSPLNYDSQRLLTLIDISNFKPTLRGSYQYILNGTPLFSLDIGNPALPINSGFPQYFETPTLKFTLLLEAEHNNVMAFHTMLSRIDLFKQQLGGEILTASQTPMTAEIKELLEQKITTFKDDDTRH